MKYGIVLKRKPYIHGLIKDEVVEMYDLLEEKEAFPIEFESRETECSAIGFITLTAASSLDYEYTFSGLQEFIKEFFLSKKYFDPNIESKNYQFRGIEIYFIWQ